MDKEYSQFVIVLLLIFFGLAVFLVLIVPMVVNNEALASTINNLKNNYKTEITCKKDVSCTLTNYSYNDKQTNSYTFKLPQKITFNSEFVPYVEHTYGYGYFRQWHKSVKINKYFVIINDYKYPVGEDFQRGLKKYLEVNYFDGIPQDVLNSDFNLMVSSSYSTVGQNLSEILLNILFVFGLLYIILCFNENFEKKYEKYFILIFIIMTSFIGILLITGLSSIVK